jgi:hypothetical protein
MALPPGRPCSQPWEPPQRSAAGRCNTPPLPPPLVMVVPGSFFLFSRFFTHLPPAPTLAFPLRTLLPCPREGGRRCASRSEAAQLPARSRPGHRETCPVSTEGGTRRVQLVREGGGGRANDAVRIPYRWLRARGGGRCCGATRRASPNPRPPRRPSHAAVAGGGCSGCHGRRAPRPAMRGGEVRAAGRAIARVHCTLDRLARSHRHAVRGASAPPRHSCFARAVDCLLRRDLCLGVMVSHHGG